MRKRFTLLLLTMLTLITGNVLAQVDVPADFYGKPILIENNAMKGKFITATTDGGNDVVKGLDKVDGDQAQQWIVTKTATGINIQNVKTKKYLGRVGVDNKDPKITRLVDAASAEKDEWSVQFNSDGTFCLVSSFEGWNNIKPEEKHLYYETKAGKVGNLAEYGGTDAGGRDMWTFTLAPTDSPDTPDTPVVVDPHADFYGKAIIIANNVAKGKVITANAEGTQVYALDKNANDEAQQWIVTKTSTGINIQNVKTKKFIGRVGGGKSNTTTLVDAGNAQKDEWSVQFNSDNTFCLVSTFKGWNNIKDEERHLQLEDESTNGTLNEYGGADAAGYDMWTYTLAQADTTKTDTTKTEPTKPDSTQTKNPLGAYEEAFDNTVVGEADWNKLGDTPQVSWASRDVHYAQRAVPTINMKTDTVVYAWKGERASMLGVIFSKNAVGKLKLTVSGANGMKATANFVNYVIGDQKTKCGANNMDTPLIYVPDVIDNQPYKALKEKSVTPIWVTVEVPRDAAPGVQTLDVAVSDEATGKTIETLRLRVNVVDRQLPEPKDYTFNTNFWQQPYAVSRYYNVPRWSQAHFNALRPYLEMLARCGQKSVTTILFYEPWGDQSIDKYDAMIKTTKMNDGTWKYDYSVFDHYVELCDSVGINKQINCFSMVPWDMTFQYYNENGDVVNTGKINVTDQAYKDLWRPFLQNFAQHLRERGWFDKTFIAMDERNLDVMQNAYKFLQECVPGMKMSLAGNYHKELADKLADYCVALHQHFTDAEIATRDANGWVTTTYTACPDVSPNLETYNDPADAAYLPIYCIANKFNGFLHWSWMSWVDKSPLTDTRYRLFPAGDYYTVYPGPRYGVRYERYIEGVQQAEKVNILRQEWAGNQEKLDSLNNQVAKFVSGSLNYNNSSSNLINALESILNGSPMPTKEPAEEYCTPTLTKNNQAADVRTQRWVTEATVSGEAVGEEPVELTWSAAPEAGYVMATQSVFLTPGKSVTLNLKGLTGQNDGLQYCRVGLFADWDIDRNFDSRDDEAINQTGKEKVSNADVLDYTVTFTVPKNAKVGETRLRAVYNDAWKDEPMPCGEMWKGFCLDIPVVILGTTNSIGKLSNDVKMTWKGGEMKTAQPVSVAAYTMQGMLVDSAKDVTSYSTAHFTPGLYIVKVTDAQGHSTERKLTK